MTGIPILPHQMHEAARPKPAEKTAGKWRYNLDQYLNAAVERGARVDMKFTDHSERLNCTMFDSPYPLYLRTPSDFPLKSLWMADNAPLCAVQDLDFGR